ncbi:N-acetylglucosamine kinase [Sandaracinobacteroides saxicola]|uniref:ATPase BadF/BadG/BcrA/BcrD type domain-containing protein n=1 Tax=Sandaracinobacteroides saxicola TaxID=2759707 RepID=A0A7G5IM41_9SPHN|nr:BadF/BadG/BcrA/BcrD ATPase family protein [Sandaracinobacteroides saxicola]QMW24433.1 hypothetical protein H3309_08305 [Sandaracinobacteroides saxicola]
MPDPRSLVLGLDGGGSKTVAFVCDDTGHVLGYARGGASEIYTRGEAAFSTISRTVQDALDQAGLSPDDLRAATYSLAGVDWPEDAVFVRERLSRSPRCAIEVRNDAVGALDGAIPQGPAVVVACGTSCGIASRNAAGGNWHSGFWQHPLGSYELGLKALQAICLGHQGIAQPTALAPLALDTLRLPHVEALLHRVTRRENPEILLLARLTPLLFDAAEAGDPVSRAIVTEHGAGLGRMAAAAARQVGISGQAMKVALTGGVFRHASSLLPTVVLDSMRQAEAQIEPVTPFGEPVLGSVIDALRRIGVPITAPVLKNLCRSMPTAAYFDTVA